MCLGFRQFWLHCYKMEKLDDLDCQDSVVLPLTETLTKDEVYRRTEADTQKALDETGFGKFNYKVVTVAGLMCMNVACSITTVGFVLPSAACDFDMDTVDKGYISTSVMFGMLCGACIWGYIADTKGRRTALLNCLFLQSFTELAASIISNYWSFLVFKFASGLTISGQMGILYTYLGEFQPTKYRGKMLSLMEIPWALGVILAPLLAWLIIPLDIEYTISVFSFKSWNLFVAMSAVLAFLIGCSLLRLPETPKYLAASRRNTDLRNVLATMYHENTGNAPEEYLEKLDKSGTYFFAISNNRSLDKHNEDDGNRSSTLSSLREFFKTFNHQASLLLRTPYLIRTVIISLDSFCIFSSLYSLMLWFPELFQRFADYEEKYPGVHASICIVSNSESRLLGNNETVINASLPMTTSNLSAIVECDGTIETQVYVHTLMLGLACIPGAIIFPLCIDRVGFRSFFVFITFSSCAVTIGMSFVTTSTQNLILSCIFEAFISISTTVLFCLIVELFPTHLRVTACVLSALFSRMGALIGNIVFGYLIDDHCYLLISIITVELFVAGMLGFFIPTGSQSDEVTQEESVNKELPDTGSNSNAQENPLPST